jgi:hypothetical protein
VVNVGDDRDVADVATPGRFFDFRAGTAHMGWQAYHTLVRMAGTPVNDGRWLRLRRLR